MRLALAPPSPWNGYVEENGQMVLIYIKGKKYEIIWNNIYMFFL